MNSINIKTLLNFKVQRVRAKLKPGVSITATSELGQVDVTLNGLFLGRMSLKKVKRKYCR